MRNGFRQNKQEFSIFPVQFSAKQRLFNQSGAIPLVTLIGYLNFGPIASANVKSNEIEGALLLAFQHELNDAMAFEWNFGSQSFRNDLKFTLLYSYKIFNRATTFVEYFSDFNKSSKPVHNADVGILYAASNNLSLDIGLGSTLDSSLRKCLFLHLVHRIDFYLLINFEKKWVEGTELRCVEKLPDITEVTNNKVTIVSIPSING
ncbi:MAG: transporter [Saprospiraceae bacterium]|nr:transporter [Saprospiraceae bacterium]